jgi:hypothetical protein
MRKVHVVEAVSAEELGPASCRSVPALVWGITGQAKEGRLAPAVGAGRGGVAREESTRRSRTTRDRIDEVSGREPFPDGCRNVRYARRASSPHTTGEPPSWAQSPRSYRFWGWLHPRSTGAGAFGWSASTVSVNAPYETPTDPGPFAGTLRVRNLCPKSTSHDRARPRVLRRCERRRSTC